MSFLNLSTKVTYLQSEDMSGTIIFIVILFLIFILLFIGGRSSRSQNVSRNRKGHIKYSKFAFRKQARKFGLSKIQIGTLEYIIKQYGIKNPFNLFSNSRILDKYLLRAINDVETRSLAEDIKEAQKLSIYRVKQIIERNAHSKKKFTSSNQLKLNQTLVLIPATGGRFSSRVTSNLKRMLSAQIPFSDKGKEIRWKKNTKVQVYFLKSSGEGFSFMSKVLGYSKVLGVSSLLLQHSNTVKQAQQRRYRRKIIDRPAYFFPINIINTGSARRPLKKAVVESNRAVLGHVSDISSGGCSLNTSYPMKVGELIKIEFDTVEDSKVNAYGKVKQIQKSARYGTLMHIMFTKISRKNLNRINAYVYDFN